MTRASRMAALATVAYLAVIAVLTIGPAPWRTGPVESDYDVLSLSTWIDPGTWSGGAAREFGANILLFVPLGMLLRWTFPRATWVGAAALGGAISFVIEVVQMWSPRVSDPRDILANTTGALVGALIAAIVTGIRRIARAARDPAPSTTREAVSRAVGGSRGVRAPRG